MITHAVFATQIHRKLALKMVKGEDPGRELDAGDLYEYVGKPVFANTRMYETTPPGVAVGLAWTSMGKCRYIAPWNAHRKQI